MSRITYNGIVIDKCTVRKSQQAVLAGFQYLHTKIVFAVQGILNRELNNGNIVNIGQLDSALVIENRIKQRLMVPRKKFIFEAVPGRGETFICPEGNLSSDVANGPIPLEFNVTRVEGRGSVFVTFVIQVNVNETISSNTNDPKKAILAHEWSMSHQLDSDFFCTRVISGRTIFRSDVLDNLNLYPDQFRESFLHELPPNFIRANIKVTALPDGNTIEYTVIDRECILPFNRNIVSRMEAALTVVDDIMSPGQILQSVASISGAAQHAAGAIFAAAAGFANQLMPSIFPLPAGSAPGTSAIGIMPMRGYHIGVSAWGCPTARPHQIRDEIMRVIDEKIASQLFDAVSIISGGKSLVTTDFSGKFVRFEKTLFSSVAGGGLLAGAIPTPPAGEAPAFVPGTLHRTNPVRGRFLAACIAQVLRPPTLGNPFVEPDIVRRGLDRRDARGRIIPAHATDRRPVEL